MKDKKLKYAELLLKCLKLDEKKYLFVRIPDFLSDFTELIKKAANDYDLKEVHIEVEEPFKKHDLLKNLDQENINKHPMFDHKEYNRYAKLDAAFLFIQSMIPNLMDDIDPKKISDTTAHTRTTEEDFRKLYETDKLNWCIAGVPNEYWAQDGLNMSLEELWDLIFKVCLVDEENDPYELWQEKLDKLDALAKTLNDYHFKYLKYTNSLGTDLHVYLPNGHVWACGKDLKGRIVNMPTEEVFTSPEYDKTEGIVYSSKPLLYNNVSIEDFSLEFKDGKVINMQAKKGEEVLKGIVKTDEYSCYLGECALVSYDSPISNTGIIFKETLYDENASCHLALGSGFNECIKDSEDKRGDDLRSLGVNDAKTHVDFMIGTNDLKVVGVTYDEEEVIIMDNGNIDI